MALMLEVEDPSVAGARRGDPLAWADLYGRYQPLLHRYLEVVDPSSLDDIDEMWARAARTLPGQPEGVEPLIWLLRTARDVKIICPSPDETSNPTIRAIRSLEPLEMDVVALRVVAGLSDEDVAMVIGRPVSRIRAVGHRGLEKLVHLVDAA
jgi:DNA-directed RNA polymerase specialized sigma24 family protein